MPLTRLNNSTIIEYTSNDYNELLWESTLSPPSVELRKIIGGRLSYAIVVTMGVKMQIAAKIIQK